jgi:hypothetical protein
MTTKIEIINLALRRIGASRINNIDSETPASKIMIDVYAQTRRSLLEEGFWSFAKIQKEITPLPDPPAFRYAYKYNYPTDCIRIVREYLMKRYVRQGVFIYSDEELLQLEYIQDVTREDQFTNLFIKCFYLQLAVEACYAITHSVQLRKELMAEQEFVLSKARTADSQDNVADQEAMQIEGFTQSRHGVSEDWLL